MSISDSWSKFASTQGWIAQPDMPCQGRTGVIATVPNVITLVRTFAAVTVLTAAIYSPEDCRRTLLFIGIVVAVAGDLLDGLVARITSSQSRFGAVFDGCADRLCLAMIFAVAAIEYQDRVAALSLYLTISIIVDFPLSLMFITCGLTSPIEFDRRSVRLWTWNFSPPAKFIHSIIIPSIALVGPLPYSVPLILASGCIKLYSAIRVSSL